ncbi:hypothetical protein GCM10009835_23730 [Planosporangium flavigriseum]|uniref:Uncharacterized protein n=1 Tax=Planosporangium flavigriseum TaxID=373681 RepID=A0A8J3LZ62_9ACTN|nr:hypothetical protein Pfl04_21590 [Planosporangium flavigriseum]
MRQVGGTPVIRRYTVFARDADEHRLYLGGGGSFLTGKSDLKPRTEADLRGKSEKPIQPWAYTPFRSTPTYGTSRYRSL